MPCLGLACLILGCRTPLQPECRAPRLQLIAPSGWPKDPDGYERGLRRLEAAGFEVRNRDCARRRDSRFCGREAERLEDLAALCAPGALVPELVMLPRGGYGAVQLLDRIDYARLCPQLKAAGTVLVGFSDFTALQMALLAKGGLITFAGPMVATNLGAAEPDRAMLDGFRSALTDPRLSLRVASPQSDRGECAGTFWGGNLCTLAALVGTPYLPRIQDGILFLEDVGEAPHRIDRMLWQLHHAGILGRQRALVLGAFGNPGLDAEDPAGFTLEHVLERWRQRLRIPVFTGLPHGHMRGMATLPVGGQARLSGDAAGFTLAFTGHPVLRRVPEGFWGPALESALVPPG